MATAIDPICKMEVDTDNPNGGSSEYNGTSYYFCAPGCKVAFDAEPEKYLAPQWQGLPMDMGESKPKPGFLGRLFGRK
jgi:YHS domain-containing protein